MRKLLGDWKTAEQLVWDLEPGDLVEFDRGTYKHWSVYVGRMHGHPYLVHKFHPSSLMCNIGSSSTGESSTDDNGKVRLEMLRDVAGWSLGRLNNTFDMECAPLPAKHVVKRAKSYVGTENYHLFSNNCEHFATYCRNGKGESAQLTDLVDSTWYYTKLVIGLLLLMAFASCL